MASEIESEFKTPEIDDSQLPFDSERFIRAVWQQCLAREPDSGAIEAETARFRAGLSPAQFFFELLECPEAVHRREALAAVPLFVPPGHYYSPIVDPSYLQQIGFQARRRGLAGLDLDLGAMGALLDRFIELTANVAFPSSPTSGARYYSSNVMYGQGDARVLSGMVRHLRPKRFIEVGSGFSSALLLDTLDDLGLQTACTFIDPHPERLRSILRSSDHSRVHIIEDGVQGVPIETFRTLESGDILFLDTTHISKTGSDVNFEVFEILPELKPGVVIHFHDVFDGFEYPDVWTFAENRSWNEQYLLRSFLMFNNDFRVLFFNDHVFRKLDTKAATLLAGNPGALGGGLWIVRN